jgi:hypothetical protein
VRRTLIASVDPSTKTLIEGSFWMRLLAAGERKFLLSAKNGFRIAMNDVNFSDGVDHVPMASNRLRTGIPVPAMPMQNAEYPRSEWPGRVRP